MIKRAVQMTGETCLFKKLQKLEVTRKEGKGGRGKIKIKMLKKKKKRNSKNLLERRDRTLLRLKEFSLKQ